MLVEVSAKLRTACGNALLARLGGDEFTLVLAHGQQPAAAEMLAERLQAALGNEVELGGHQLRISLSIGVAIFPVDGSDGNTLLANADATLYRAKAAGRDCLVCAPRIEPLDRSAHGLAVDTKLPEHRRRRYISA